MRKNKILLGVLCFGVFLFCACAAPHEDTIPSENNLTPVIEEASPTEEPVPTATTAPTATPEPTVTPEPTATPVPTESDLIAERLDYTLGRKGEGMSNWPTDRYVNFLFTTEAGDGVFSYRKDSIIKAGMSRTHYVTEENFPVGEQMGSKRYEEFTICDANGTYDRFVYSLHSTPKVTKETLDGWDEPLYFLPRIKYKEIEFTYENGDKNVATVTLPQEEFMQMFRMDILQSVTGLEEKNDIYNIETADFSVTCRIIFKDDERPEIASMEFFVVPGGIPDVKTYQVTYVFGEQHGDERCVLPTWFDHSLIDYELAW